MDIRFNMLVFIGSRISIEFDIVRYVLIFLMIFGHKLGTNLKEEGSDEHRRKYCPPCHEELKYEDEKQEVLYSELHRLCDPWPDSLEKNLTFKENQELLNLNKERQRGESEALARRPEFSTCNSAEETQSNLRAVLSDLRKTNDNVERIIEIIKKVKR
jgi:hypothetical protein